MATDTTVTAETVEAAEPSDLPPVTAPIDVEATPVPERRIEILRPRLYPKQEAAIYDPARLAIIEAATKTGKTAGCICWLLEKAFMGRPGHQFWWVAPTLNVGKIAFRRMKRALPADAFTTNESEVSITLVDTETTITFKGADRPDTLYGEDVQAAVMDECTRVKEDAWTALRSTVTATRGPIRLIGNKKGRRNWAYRLARKAEAGEPGMAWHKLTSHDAIEAGIFPLSEYEDARRVMPPAIFAQLYDAADGDDEGNPFGLAAIASCLVTELSTKPVVAWGWDLGKSIDYTVGSGLDEDGCLAAFERFQKKPWPETIDVIVARTGGCRALVDSTGVGDAILDGLHDHPRGGSNFEGFVFTAKSKQQLVEGLAASLQGRHVRYPEGPISLELESFEYVYTAGGGHYSAPEGFNDDCVCSLALADLLRKSSGSGRGGLGIPGGSGSRGQDAAEGVNRVMASHGRRAQMRGL